jgi:hypothetical protein
MGGYILHKTGIKMTCASIGRGLLCTCAKACVVTLWRYVLSRYFYFTNESCCSVLQVLCQMLHAKARPEQVHDAVRNRLPRHEPHLLLYASLE